MHYKPTVPAAQSKLSSAAGVLTIPGDPARCAILIGTPAGRTTLVRIGAGDDSAFGIGVSPNVGYLLLTAETLGTGIREPITLADSAGAQQTFSWCQFLESP